MRERRIQDLLLIILAGCSGSAAGPSDDFVLPAVPTAWQIVADTARLFPDSENPKFVSITTRARDLSDRSTLLVGCYYTYGDPVVNTLPTSRSVRLNVSPDFFASFPLVVNDWRPNAVGDPQFAWAVPIRSPSEVFLSESEIAVFWETIKSKNGLQLYWIESGPRIERNFDIRLLASAATTIDAMCHRQ